MADLLTAVRAAVEIPAIGRFSVRIRREVWPAGRFVAKDANDRTAGGRHLWVSVYPGQRQLRSWFFDVDELLSEEWLPCPGLTDEEDRELEDLAAERRRVTDLRIQSAIAFKRDQAREPERADLPFGEILAGLEDRRLEILAVVLDRIEVPEVASA